MRDSGLVPVFHHSDPQVVIGVAEACAAGGARLIEITNRGDFTWQAFAEFERHCARKLPELITGAGSIVDPETAALYVNCGANFIVGPNLNPDVARFCNRRKIPYSPGCGTASEIAHAEELGAEIVKIFPGDLVGGPEFVRALRAPCPWTSIMPTGGVDVTESSLSEWFRAGIVCAGIGSKMITKELVERRDYAGITRNVRQVIEIIGRLKA
jgi:2-dehydro-3-deoxyphosphogluconate aldolase/(4S)-4-hydroxy-2-oxoglutarate aldolase